MTDSEANKSSSPNGAVLPHEWKLPEGIVRRLGYTAGRQRAMAADGHLLIILHECPGDYHLERRAVLYWRSPEGEWKSDKSADGIESLRDLVEKYAEALDRLDEKQEDADEMEELFSVLEQLWPLRHSARQMLMALQEARNSVEDRRLIDVRDRAENIERAMELLYLETKNNQELLLAMRTEAQISLTERMALSTHRLNILAAFFLPLATVTSVYGMNIKNGFEDRPIAFFIIVVAGFVAGFALAKLMDAHTPQQHKLRKKLPDELSVQSIHRAMGEGALGESALGNSVLGDGANKKANS